MAHRLLKISVCYFVAAVLVGFYMGATGDLSMIPVHAHLNLLGWVSLAIIGCIYLLRPHLAETGLARAHFWLHNLSVPPLMVAVAFVHLGHAEAEPIAGMLSLVTVIGIIAFAINLWRGLGNAASRSA